MKDFINFPAQNVTLKNVQVYQSDTPTGLSLTQLSIANGKIVADTQPHVIDLKGSMLLPTFVDMHTHIDKGHIWHRSPNPDGTFSGALDTVLDDREAHWNESDLRKRMEFSLKCAYAHGTSAIRTHLDSIAPQEKISWPVFCDLRKEWAGRIDLQASCLIAIDNVDSGPEFLALAKLIQQSGGTLGAFTFPVDDIDERLDTFLSVAAAHDLDVDFHADETHDPESKCLRSIAQAVIRTGFKAPVTVGHCCSIAMQSESEANLTLDWVAKAGLNIVSLPLCNLYLQARAMDKTPRWRGVTLVHEMRQKGISVSFASDNTRDPFYAYGDLDMVEVMRESVRIAHLDHTEKHWLDSFSANPSKACSLPVNDLSVGSSADFVLFNARSMNEFLARPQMDRVVIRNGKPIVRDLPNYSELDDLPSEN
jgi:cytosine deaminase